MATIPLCEFDHEGTTDLDGRTTHKGGVCGQPATTRFIFSETDDDQNLNVCDKCAETIQECGYPVLRQTLVVQRSNGAYERVPVG